MLPHIEGSNPRASEYINLPIFADSYNETEHVTQGAEPHKVNVEIGMRNLKELTNSKTMSATAVGNWKNKGP